MDESFQANSFRNLAIAGTFMVLIERMEKVLLHGVNRPDLKKIVARYASSFDKLVDRITPSDGAFGAPASRVN
ncbi:hypothetical protein [Paraburkholderia diazotrophica]|uniref:hypothetical protein n=1 Tax=Paraburkholderia diazotrophica TaxID=667676 RepID=UPI001C430D22|nr:hypothetical protein [Paraburkholderia diazotrophica]